VKRPIAAVVLLAAAGFTLSGCPSRPYMREPADAYSAHKVELTERAVASHEEAIRAAPASPEAARSAYILARRAAEAGKTDELDAKLGWFERNQPTSPWLAPALLLRIQASRDTEGSLSFLRRMNDAVTRFPADTGLRDGCLALLPSTLSAATLSDLDTFVSTAATSGPLMPDSMLTLGKLRKSKGDTEEATRVLRRLTAQFPGAPALNEAFAILKELSRQFPVEPSVIAALVPSSGKFSSYGDSVMNGISLAVEDLKSGGHQFEFVVADTGGDPEQAVAAMDKMFKERKAIAVFGPLFSATALACAAEANLLGIVMLTPSALASRLTQTGPYVFRASLSPEQQARTMARFAVEKRGFRRFGILAPDGAYGRSLSAAFASEVVALGATVLADSRFPPESADFTEAIVTLGGADVAGTNEMGEEFRRAAQGELEAFLRDFFQAAAAGAPPAPSSTTGEAVAPVVSRIACLLLSSDPFTAEMGSRLRAAALPNKTISVLTPESATGYSGRLPSADVTSNGPLSGNEEVALSDLLGQQAAVRNAPLAVLISVASLGDNGRYDTLDCNMAMYETSSARRLATHRFQARRALPPKGNRFELEAVYLPAPGSQVIKIIPQLVYHEMKLPMLGSDSWDEDELTRRPEAVGTDAWFTTGFWPAHDRPATRQFVTRYQERFAAPPDMLAANAYDGARLLMEAILRSDGTREGLRETITNFGPFNGAAGEFRMGTSREPEKEAFVLKIEGGSIVAVQ